MKPIITLILFILFATNTSADSCSPQRDAVSALRSSAIMVAYVNNKPGQDRKSDLALAASFGDPLALSLLASNDELPLKKRVEFLQLAAAIEYSPVYGDLGDLVQQISKPVPLHEYQFQMIRNAVRVDDIYLHELQNLALKSGQKHHQVAAIFWSIVLSDSSNNSMGASQERANGKLLEAKLQKPQLNELRTRALLFRCERQAAKIGQGQ
jgi:hypothetical protein